MKTFLKSNFWYIVGGLVTVLAFIFIKDMDRISEIQSFFRRKKVEEEVDILKRSLTSSKTTQNIAEDKLVNLAEELKLQEKNVKEMDDHEIKEFYEEYFNRK